MKEKIKDIFGDVIYLNDNMFILAENFSELFSDSEDFSYDELMRVEKENNFGYKKHIEKWEKEGLIE